MADMDDTARARPMLHPGQACDSVQQHSHPSTLTDVTRGTLAVVGLLAHCVAARQLAPDQVLQPDWHLQPDLVGGLAATLLVLSERASTLAARTEDPAT